MKTPHAHAQGVPVFDSKEIVLSKVDYSALLLAACAESGALIALVELGAGVFPERCLSFSI